MNWNWYLQVGLLALALVGKSRGDTPNETASCPPWMTHRDSQCHCNSAYSNIFQRNFIRSVYCDELSLTTYAASGTCFTQSNSSLFEEDYVIGDCPYIPVRDQHYYQGFLKPLPEFVSDLDKVMCGPFNRQGLLCSSCRQGYGIAVYSIGYPCAKCSGSRSLFAFLYVLLELVPITVFYAIVVMFRVRATAPPLAGLVFFSHVILNTVRIRVLIYTKLLFSTPKLVSVVWQLIVFLCSIWSLDFFRVWVPPFCIDQHLTNIHAVLLEYLSAFFPMILVFFTFVMIELHGHNVRLFVWLWRPFNRLFARFRRSWNIQYSIVNAFSTFLLLSYSKILTVSFRLLYQTSIYDLDKRRIARRLYIDPTTQNFGSPLQSFLSIVAISIIIIFSFLPVFLLLLYPTRIFQKVLRLFTCRAKHAVHIFVDTYQGCLKDGSDGTRDFRTLSALYLILRICLLSLYIRDTELVRSGLAFVIFCLVFTATAIFILKFQPYKDNSTNIIEFVTFTVLGSMSLFVYIWIIFPRVGYVFFLATMGLLPHCIVACFFVYSTFVRYKARKALSRLQSRLRRANSGFPSSTTLHNLLRRFNPSLRRSNEEELPDRFVNPENYIQDDAISSKSNVAPTDYQHFKSLNKTSTDFSTEDETL